MKLIANNTILLKDGMRVAAGQPFEGEAELIEQGAARSAEPPAEEKAEASSIGAEGEGDPTPGPSPQGRGGRRSAKAE